MITAARRRELIVAWRNRADELDRKAELLTEQGSTGLAAIYRRNARESRDDAAELERELSEWEHRRRSEAGS